MRFSRKEIADIVKAWAAISIAFAVVLAGVSANFFFAFLISALSVGIGFIFHELAHKFVAQYYSYHAEFRSFDLMLVLAVAMSFLGFVIAAPGAVLIYGRLTKERGGKISAAGIVASLFAAIIFLAIYLIFAGDLVASIARYGLLINSWLAIFNLIPVGAFDGSKVFRWNKGVYFGLAVAGVVLLALGGRFSL